MNRTSNRARIMLALIVMSTSVGTPYLRAQTLGTSPQLNVAVKGQTGAQPEGAILNFVNWIGNVVAPVGAGGAVFAAIVAFLSGRGSGRWLLGAAGLLAVSGILRLIEFWIQQGVAGIS